MDEPFFRTSAVSGAGATYVDQGLRAHMQRVFGYMAAGLGITGVVAFLTANTGFGLALLHSPVIWLAILAPLGFMFYLNAKIKTISVGAAQKIFWAFCTAMGLSMASIFLIYAQADIARAFFITGSMFAGMALWGYTTRKDLTGMGAFMMMGLMGVLIASLVNIFLGSSGLQWVVSMACVLIFTGLTAFDVQRIKYSYSASYGDQANNKMAVMSALSLYLNFINLFQAILSLMGGRRD